MIQQARCDPANGQQSLQAFRLLSFGLGSIIGGTTSAITEQYFTPYHAFFFAFLFSLALTVASVFVPDELETNKYAIVIVIFINPFIYILQK